MLLGLFINFYTISDICKLKAGISSTNSYKTKCMYLSIVEGESIASKENLVGDVNSSLINKGNNIIGHS